MPRPTVDVVVPFAGGDAELAAVSERCGALRLRDGDSIVVVDNRPGRRASASFAGAVHVVEDGAVASSYYARNVGAAGGTAEWLLFLDADVRFDTDLLDRLFDPLLADDVGVIAGGIVDEVVDDTPVARLLARRGGMSQRIVTDRERPYAQTAHCAVRRRAFEAVGGFAVVRSGGDADLCLALAEAGWRLEARHDVAVCHATRATLRAALRQMVRHGAGAAWVEQRHPGTFPARRWPGLIAWGVRRLGRRDTALDALLVWAFEAGRMVPNRARRRSGTVGPWRRSTSTG